MCLSSQRDLLEVVGRCGDRNARRGERLRMLGLGGRGGHNARGDEHAEPAAPAAPDRGSEREASASSQAADRRRPEADLRGARPPARPGSERSRGLPTGRRGRGRSRVEREADRAAGLAQEVGAPEGAQAAARRGSGRPALGRQEAALDDQLQLERAAHRDRAPPLASRQAGRAARSGSSVTNLLRGFEFGKYEAAGPLKPRVASFAWRRVHGQSIHQWRVLTWNGTAAGWGARRRRFTGPTCVAEFEP